MVLASRSTRPGSHIIRLQRTAFEFQLASNDARSEMIRVYERWISEFDIDGYRFDVYWGPHRRYGEEFMGKPVRDALKHIKPEILLLAEDDGTGPGTETIYADVTTAGFSGGVDAAYDFKLYFNSIRSFGFSSSAINGLHNELNNGGYYPGEHALYMRFMESQDEDRIVFFYSSNSTLDALTTFQRTMPMATVLFTAPGFPMIWNGQEIGWVMAFPAQKRRGTGVSSTGTIRDETFSRRTIKTRHVAGQFSAFTQHKRDTNGDGQVNAADSSDFLQVPSSSGEVYAFARPYENQNGVTAVNFSASAQSFTLDLTVAGALRFSAGIQPAVQYYVNDLYSNVQRRIPGSSSMRSQYPYLRMGVRYSRCRLCRIR